MDRQIGTMIVVAGIVLVIVGVLFASGLMSWFGHLPGDIRIERDNFRMFIPITTMILLSIILTIVLTVLRRYF